MLIADLLSILFNMMMVDSFKRHCNQYFNNYELDWYLNRRRKVYLSLAIYLYLIIYLSLARWITQLVYFLPSLYYEISNDYVEFCSPSTLKMTHWIIIGLIWMGNFKRDFRWTALLCTTTADITVVGIAH